MENAILADYAWLRGTESAMVADSEGTTLIWSAKSGIFLPVVGFLAKSGRFILDREVALCQIEQKTQKK